MPPPPTFEVRLARARMLTPQVRELEFERVDGLRFDFEAGQWVSLVLPLSEGEARRAYSVASPPLGTSRFEVAVTKVSGGNGSTFLHRLAVGDTLHVIGPQGFFTRAKEPHPSLFIGTGTGVTPLRSMIRDALAAGDSSPMILLFGARFEIDRLYVDELDDLVSAHPGFRYAFSLSQPSETWAGRRGYVQTHVEELWAELAAKGSPHAYICGLDRMVSTVRDLLRKHLKADRKQVHSERYD